MLADMARYMHNDYSSLGGGYSAADFPHSNMPHMYWWDWNANSGDTGGIVQDDWLTVSVPKTASSFSAHFNAVSKPVALLFGKDSKVRTNYLLVSGCKKLHESSLLRHQSMHMCSIA